MTIKVLPPEISNQIAAGEVVERPASVVKECVENALDAKATAIEIHLHNGGKQLIKIIDNGQGITQADLPKAILRHATSKIASSEDLFHLQQYGFRGEALAAVASVSGFTLTSKTADSADAYTLKGQAGVFEDPALEAANDGTTIAVANLFKPVPARLEYLKSAEAEYRACLKEIYGFALANPAVSFTIFKDDKKTLDYPATTLEDRVKQVLKKVSQDLCPVELATPNFNLTGFTSAPGKGLSNKNQQYVLVNGRRIEDHRLAYAVREAYVQSAGIEKHLFPAFVLHLTIDPILVDVNVHPRKLEVKFAEPGEIFSAFKMAIIKALENVSYNQEPSLPRADTPMPVTPSQGSSATAFNFSNSNKSYAAAPKISGGSLPSFADRNKTLESFNASLTANHNFEAPSESIRLIGQADNKYIVAQTTTGIYFFDQHALHERQRFETFWQDYKNAPITEQPLLVPETITLPEDQVSLLHQHQTVLATLGFDLAFESDETVQVNGIGELLVGQDLATLLGQCVSFLENEKIGENVSDQIMRQLLEYKACRGAVMFGDKLEHEEMEKLIQDFDSTDWKLLCPHGRPNHHFVPFKELDGYFHR